MSSTIHARDIKESGVAMVQDGDGSLTSSGRWWVGGFCSLFENSYHLFQSTSLRDKVGGRRKGRIKPQLRLVKL